MLPFLKPREVLFSTRFLMHLGFISQLNGINVFIGEVAKEQTFRWWEAQVQETPSNTHETIN